MYFLIRFHTIKSILNFPRAVFPVPPLPSFPYYKVNFKRDKMKVKSLEEIERFPYYKVNFKLILLAFILVAPICCFHTIKSILNKISLKNN